MSNEGDATIWAGLTTVGVFLLTCIGFGTKSQNNKIEDIKDEVALTRTKETCEVLHTGVQSEIKLMRVDIVGMKTEIKDGFQRLHDRLDRN